MQPTCARRSTPIRVPGKPVVSSHHVLHFQYRATSRSTEQDGSGTGTIEPQLRAHAVQAGVARCNTPSAAALWPRRRCRQDGGRIEHRQIAYHSPSALTPAYFDSIAIASNASISTHTTTLTAVTTTAATTTTNIPSP